MYAICSSSSDPRDPRQQFGSSRSSPAAIEQEARPLLKVAVEQEVGSSEGLPAVAADASQQFDRLARSLDPRYRRRPEPAHKEEADPRERFRDPTYKSRFSAPAAGPESSGFTQFAVYRAPARNAVIWFHSEDSAHEDIRNRTRTSSCSGRICQDVFNHYGLETMFRLAQGRLAPS